MFRFSEASFNTLTSSYTLKLRRHLSTDTYLCTEGCNIRQRQFCNYRLTLKFRAKIKDSVRTDFLLPELKTFSGLFLIPDSRLSNR